MNMFRDLLMSTLIILGLALWFSNANDWTWVEYFGYYGIASASFLASAQPFSTLICLVLALALFMTRLKY